MRTTLSLPDDLLKEAVEASGAKTYTATIIMALKELIHKKRLKELRELKGNLDIEIDLGISRER